MLEPVLRYSGLEQICTDLTTPSHGKEGEGEAGGRVCPTGRNLVERQDVCMVVPSCPISPVDIYQIAHVHMHVAAAAMPELFEL